MPNVSDIDELLTQIQVGAEKRGIRVFDAVFPTEPIVVFNEGTTSVDDALDLAESQFAHFVSVEVTRLNPTDLEGLWDDGESEEPAPPPEAARILAEHEGDSDGLFLRWLGGGATFLYIAVPEWKVELDALLEAEQGQQALRRVDERLAYGIRVTHLADQLEGNPAFRGGNAQTRRSIGKTLLEPLLKADDDSRLVQIVLDRATRLARDNGIGAYAQLADSLEELAQELLEDVAWQTARTLTDRATAARDILISHADGYAPTAALVERLRRLADLN